MNTTLKTIEERRSIRSYTSESLTSQEIEIILKAGLQAPTARNKQEIHISVLEGSHPILKEIENEKRILQAIDKDEETRQTIFSAKQNFYYDAPIVFLLSADKDFSWSQVDAGIAVENMALAAQSLGLGNVILGVIKKAMLGSQKEYFAKVCRFPDNYEFVIALAVGHTKTDKKPHMIDFVHAVSLIK